MHPEYFDKKGGDDDVVIGTPGKYELHVRVVCRDQILEGLERKYYNVHSDVYVSKAKISEELFTDFLRYTQHRGLNCQYGIMEWF